MKQYYQDIKEAYNTFHRTLLKRGQFPWKDTSIGYWGVSVSDEVFELFKKIKLENFNHLVDIGSGDGRVVMIASLFTNATGIEFDPWLVNCSKVIKSKLNHVPHIANTTFIQKDFMKHDLGEFDAIYWNPDKPMSTGIERKLIREMKGKLIVHGTFHHPRFLKKESTHDIQGTYFSVFSND